MLDSEYEYIKIKGVHEDKKSKSNILIIGNNNEHIRFLFDTLKYGFDLFYSDNINDAIKKINSKPLPDLMIIDYFMDKENDFIFLENLDHDCKLSSSPLFIFCSKISNEYKIK